MAHEPVWQVIGQSVRGASHARTGLPNQDAIHWFPESQQGPPLILVLSDGHGSTKSFRSEVGSRIAVEQTARLLHEFLRGQPRTANLTSVKRTAEERIPQELVRRWQQSVDAHLKEMPFTDEELARLTEKRGGGSRSELSANPRLAYGATVLAVLVTREYLLFLQLGDGDMLTVMENGEVLRPLERDSRLFANETTSLCMDRAWREVRLRFQACYGPLPALVLVATDGYANSFINDSAFLKVGPDILDILKADGLAAVQTNLPGWLEEASTAGSGDDITLGLLFRRDLLPSTVAATERAEGTREHSLADQAAGSVAEPAVAEASTTAAAASSVVSEGGAQLEGSGEAERDAGLRSRLVARLKHEGPREPAKSGRLVDLVGEHEDNRPGHPSDGSEAEEHTTTGDATDTAGGANARPSEGRHTDSAADRGTREG